MLAARWVAGGAHLGRAGAAMSRSAFCGLSRGHRGELVTELAPRRETRWEPGRRQRRRGDRRRQAGAGPEYELAFTGRLLVTLARLRTGLAREALGVIYQAGSCAIGRAIGEIRPLLAGRGFAVPQRPGLRLRTLADEHAAYAGRWPLLPPGFVITCAAPGPGALCGSKGSWTRCARCARTSVRRPCRT